MALASRNPRCLPKLLESHRPQRHHDHRGRDQTDEQQSLLQLAPAEDVGRQIGNRREHRSDTEGLRDEGQHQQEEPAVLSHRRETFGHRRLTLGLGVGPCPADHGPADHRGDHQQEPDDHSHPGVARASGPERIDQDRGTSAEQQDRQREEHDPDAHDPGALLVVVGELRRHRQVRDLERREPCDREQEEHPDPQRGGVALEERRRAERQREHRADDDAADK